MNIMIPVSNIYTAEASFKFIISDTSGINQITMSIIPENEIESFTLADIVSKFPISLTGSNLIPIYFINSNELLHVLFLDKNRETY